MLRKWALNPTMKLTGSQPQGTLVRWIYSTVHASSNQPNNPQPKLAGEMSGICLRLNTCKNVFDPQAENSELQHLKVFQKNTEGLIEVEQILNDWFNERITTKLIVFRNARFLIWPSRSNAVVLTWTRRMSSVHPGWMNLDMGQFLRKLI